MPLLNSMGVLRNMGINPQAVPTYFMYMFAGITGAPNQNTITIGSYDTIQGKLVNVNAAADQIIAYTDNSNIVFNGTKGGLYSYHMDTYDNNVSYDTAGFSTGNLSTNLSKEIQFSTSGFGQTIYNNNGDIIKIAIATTSGAKHILAAKYTTSGTVIWQNRYTLPNSTGVFLIRSMCVDSSNDIYFCGQYDASGSSVGTTGMWGKITDSGTLSYLKYQNNLILNGITCVGSTLYFAMAISSVYFDNYQVGNIYGPAAQACVASASSSTGSFTKISWLDTGTTNHFFPTSIEADSNNVFLSGYWQISPGTGIVPPVIKGFIIQFNTALDTITSQKFLSFSVNTVVNPTYTYNYTYIDRIQYQAASDSYYITGTTADSAAGQFSATTYMNSFTIRAKVNINYNGTILDRTYNITDLVDTYTLTNVATFAGTSFASVRTTTTFTVTVFTSSINGYSTVPIKVLL